jgi:hypothetical protein
LVEATTVSATGNVTGGNLFTGGEVSATGNISATANISGGNIITGYVQSSGNIDASIFVATVGFETAALGSFSTPIPALNNTGINISVFGVIKGFGILSQSLTGTISLNSASYTTLEIRSPILIRIL